MGFSFEQTVQDCVGLAQSVREGKKKSLLVDTSNENACMKIKARACICLWLMFRLYTQGERRGEREAVRRRVARGGMREQEERQERAGEREMPLLRSPVYRYLLYP